MRHWHAKQDEFIYILEGEVTLVTDSGRQKLTPGMTAGFPLARPTDTSSSTRRGSLCSTWRSATARRRTGRPTARSTWRRAWSRENGCSPTRTEALTSEPGPHQERPRDRSEKPRQREAGRFHSGRKNRGTWQGPCGISRRAHD